MNERLDQTVYHSEYDIIPPPEGEKVRLVWTFGSDAFSSSVAEKLQYRPNADELQFALDAASRKPDALSFLQEARGRTAIFKSPFEAVLPIPFHTLEVSGFGWQNYEIVKGGLIIYHPKMNYPNNCNYSTSNPQITTTQVVMDAGITKLENPFSFTGAYTRPQAAFKTSASLAMFQVTLDSSYSFYAPLPIAIGSYEKIRDLNGNPAYFIIFRVPYEGKRTGNNLIHDSRELDSELIDKLPDIYRIGLLLRGWHDQLQITHNQATVSNFHCPRREQGVVYLADYSTLFPFNIKHAALTRAVELAKVIMSTWDLIQLFNRKPSELKSGIQLAADAIVRAYIRPNEYIKPYAYPTNYNDLINCLKRLFSGLPIPNPQPALWQNIQQLSRTISTQITY